MHCVLVRCQDALMSSLILLNRSSATGHLQPVKTTGLTRFAVPLFNESAVTLMYEMAQKNNVDYLILGASSCGAWRCNPNDVAQEFKEVGQRFDGVCERVVYAIMKPTREMLFTHRHVDSKCNYDVFAAVLDCPEHPADKSTWPSDCCSARS
jgi:hypothetical protein